MNYNVVDEKIYVSWTDMETGDTNLKELTFAEETIVLLDKLVEMYNEADLTNDDDMALYNKHLAELVALGEAEEDSIHNDIICKKGRFYHGSNEEVEIPEALVEEMKFNVSAGKNVEVLVNFWKRILKGVELNKDIWDKNMPEYIVNYVMRNTFSEEIAEQAMKQGYTEEKAFEFAQVPEVQITSEGFLQCFKVVDYDEAKTKYRFEHKDGKVVQVLRENYEYVVDEFTGKQSTEPVAKDVEVPMESLVFKPAIYTNGDDFYSGNYKGQIYRVGQVASFKPYAPTDPKKFWSFVNTNCHQSCVKGLHIGGLSYIKNYETDNTVTLICVLDPVNIGAVLERDEVIRCVEFMPISIRDRKNIMRGRQIMQKYIAAHV